MREVIRNNVWPDPERASVLSRAPSFLLDEFLTEPKSALLLLREPSNDPSKLASFVRIITALLARSPTQIHPLHVQALSDNELRRLLNGTTTQGVLEENAQRLLTLSATCERAAASDLPPIPGECVRATHFTSGEIGSLLMRGGDFSYRRQAIISATSDAFSLNEDVWKLLATGKYGAFSREWFGSHVVLMDIPNPEHRLHHLPLRAPGTVDNSRILGVFNRTSRTLTFNPHYDPSKPIQIEHIQEIQTPTAAAGRAETRDSRSHVETNRYAPIAALPTASDSIDVW